MSSPLHCPPKIGIFVDYLEITIGKDDVHRYELVGDEPMASLQEAMATTETGPEYTGALTTAGHYFVN